MRRIGVVLLLAIMAACRAEVPRPQLVVLTPARVIFLALDSARWEQLDQFIAAGKMPNLTRIARQGDRRVLITTPIAIPDVVWTTDMTGVSPLEHRVFDTSDVRAVPALWDMVTDGGKRVEVFGMPIAIDPHADEPAARAQIARDHPDLAIVYVRETDPQRLDAIIGAYVALSHQYGAQIVIASDGDVYLRWHPGLRLPVASPGTLRATDICDVVLRALKLPRKLDDYRHRFRAPHQDNRTRTATSFENEGILLVAAGRNEEAIVAFENVLRLKPKNAEAMWSLSDLLHRMHRDPRRADALLDQAIAANDREPALLMERGRIRMERKNCRGARDDFARAAVLASNNAAVFASLGRAERCLGDRKAAERAFQRSLQIDPNQPALRR